MQASVLQRRCGALAQSLQLLLSRSLVYGRDLQTQVDALRAPTLWQLSHSLHEAPCADACRQDHEIGAWELRVLDLGWAGTQGTVRYPSSMNCNSIKWPQGATFCALILKEHDQFMMRSALRQLSAQASASVAPRLSLWGRRQIFCKQPTSARATSASRLSFVYHL